MDIKNILFAVIMIALGLSFAYKCLEAILWGRTWYWSGFLPFGLFSPLLIHWPPPKRSLIKKLHAWWIHITLGPVFFLCTLVCLAAGFDKLGLNGTRTINQVLNFGRTDIEPAITFSSESGYKFPILIRIQKKLYNLLIAKKIPLKPGQAMPGQERLETEYASDDEDTKAEQSSHQNNTVSKSNKTKQ